MQFMTVKCYANLLACEPLLVTYSVHVVSSDFMLLGTIHTQNWCKNKTTPKKWICAGALNKKQNHSFTK